MKLREVECGPFDMDYTGIIRSLLNETDIHTRAPRVSMGGVLTCLI